MTDLSDFGGGVDRDEPNPEDEINRSLSQWLRHDDRNVYWDRDRTYGNGTFSVSTRQRPDLVVTSKHRNYAIEVKRSWDSSNIHDGAVQVYRYWKDLVDREAKYTVDGRTLNIDAVLLASDKSVEGHLFHDWSKKDVRRSQRSEGSQRAADYGFIPQIEHATTETLNRMLHRFSKEYNDEATVGIGTLLSSALDGDDPHADSAHPAALMYTHGNSGMDGKHVENWHYIPWYLND